MNEGIMKYEQTLPEDFTGTFYFTNDSDEEFVGIWGKKEYHFPANSTSPMIIPEHSPLEIQHIRKKFAKDWAEREFYKSTQYKALKRQERNDDGSPKLGSIHQAGTYSVEDLTSLIQRCLRPLERSKATVSKVKEQPLEDKLVKDEDGKLVTEAIDKKASLRDKALKG